MTEKYIWADHRMCCCHICSRDTVSIPVPLTPYQERVFAQEREENKRRFVEAVQNGRIK